MRRAAAWRSALLVAGLLGACAAALGCATSAPGATMAQLQSRAVYDLGCPPAQVAVYHLDARTKAAMGCGRRLIYVESCQRIRGRDSCTWVLDTPSFAQAQWPQLYATPPAATYVVVPAPPSAARPMATSLFDGRAATAPPGPPTQAPRASTTSPPSVPTAPSGTAPPPSTTSSSGLFPDPFVSPPPAPAPSGAAPLPPGAPPDDNVQGRIISTELDVAGAGATESFD